MEVKTMEYQDSEVYRDDEAPAPWIKMIPTEDGGADLEFDTTSPQYHLLEALAEIKGVSIEDVIVESIDLIWSELLKTNPCFEDVLGFHEAFEPGF
jgi:hypothetical protein